MEKKENFSITVDPLRSYVEVRLEGFLDLDSVADFDEHYRAAKARLPANRNRHLTLIDISQLKLQAQSVVSDFALMLGDPTIQSARLAFVVGDSLAKMQLRRLLHENAASFETVAEARDWLFA